MEQILKIKLNKIKLELFFLLNNRDNLEEYKNKLKIKNNNKLYDYKTYKNKHITNIEVNIDHFFNNIISQRERYINTLLKTINYKENWQNDLIKQYKKEKNNIFVSNSFNNSKGNNFKKYFKFLFFNDIFFNTYSSNIKHNLKDLFIDFFHKKIIKSSFITDNHIKYLTRGNIFNYTRQTSIASVINPLTFYSMCNELMINENIKYIFNPCGSWLVPAVIFNLFNIEKIIVVDVINSYKKNIKLLNNNIELILKPSELIYEDKIYVNKHKNKMDLIFFCPPYFKYELYDNNNKNQSTTNYTTYVVWLNKYWRNTIKLNYELLKKDKKMFYIICSQLYDDLKKICIEENFTFINHYQINIKNSSIKKSNSCEYLVEYIKK